MKSSPIVDSAHPVDYTSTAVPPTYICHDCDATSCKLWRHYNMFLDHQTLLCVDCAGKKQGRDVSGMNENGYEATEQTDQIGNLIPAVPTEENDTFWGYTSVPSEGVEWWRQLPTRPMGIQKSPEPSC